MEVLSSKRSPASTCARAIRRQSGRSIARSIASLITSSWVRSYPHAMQVAPAPSLAPNSSQLSAMTMFFRLLPGHSFGSGRPDPAYRPAHRRCIAVTCENGLWPESSWAVDLATVDVT